MAPPAYPQLQYGLPQPMGMSHAPPGQYPSNTSQHSGYACCMQPRHRPSECHAMHLSDAFPLLHRPQVSMFTPQPPMPVSASSAPFNPRMTQSPANSFTTFQYPSATSPAPPMAASPSNGVHYPQAPMSSQSPAPGFPQVGPIGPCVLIGPSLTVPSVAMATLQPPSASGISPSQPPPPLFTPFSVPVCAHLMLAAGLPHCTSRFGVTKQHKRLSLCLPNSSPRRLARVHPTSSSQSPGPARPLCIRHHLGSVSPRSPHPRLLQQAPHPEQPIWCGLGKEAMVACIPCG